MLQSMALQRVGHDRVTELKILSFPETIKSTRAGIQPIVSAIFYYERVQIHSKEGGVL